MTSGQSKMRHWIIDWRLFHRNPPRLPTKYNRRPIHDYTRSEDGPHGKDVPIVNLDVFRSAQRYLASCTISELEARFFANAVHGSSENFRERSIVPVAAPQEIAR